MPIPPKLASASSPIDSSHSPSHSQPPSAPTPTSVSGRHAHVASASAGGAPPPLPPHAPSASSLPPVASAPTSPINHSDGGAGAAAASGGAAYSTGGGGAGGGHVSSGSGGGAGNGGGSRAPNWNRRTSRSSDSGGVAVLASSPPVKSSSSHSGVAAAAPPASAAAAAAAASGGGGGVGPGHVGRGRLQQLGQRLNFGNLVRKKQTTFAPGVGGGGGGGAGTLSGGEESSGGGGHSSWAQGGGSGGSGVTGAPAAAAAAVEAFNPPNHPVNPFSYLATPFRVMARTKAGAAMGRYATTALRLKRDGMPPASYMWLWLGNFKRWHRRYFVASEAPGVLLIYKRANMKGKVWSTSLCDAVASQDDSHPRQIRLVTPAGTIFLRVLRPEERQPWLTCLRDSVATYRKHKEVVESLTAAAAEGGEGGGGVPGSLPAGALPPAAAVEQDAEQRRRIRAALAERLGELAPLVGEVERHVGLLGAQMAGVAAGLGHLPGPLLPLHTSRARQTPGAAAAASAAAAAAAAESSSSLLRPSPAGTGSGRPSLSGRRGELGAAAAGPFLEGLASFGAEGLGGGGAGGGVGGGGGGSGGGMVERLLVRTRSRSRGGPTAAPGPPAASLSGALVALVEGLRAALHADAVRIASLEAENAALNKTVNILRSSALRQGAARSRGLSTPGGPAGAAAAGGGPGGAAGSSLAALAGGGAGGAVRGGGGEEEEDGGSEGGSACTADEDAFDVVEAFDEGVDYSILDDDAPHLHHRLGVDDEEEAPYAAHGSYPAGGEEEEEEDDEEGEEEDAAELAQQAEVLNALEVVRQVEYIAANGKSAQLQTLLAADTPPPPDAEEEEEEDEEGGGKGGKRKGRGRGEDTDATLDDEYDEYDDIDTDAATTAAIGGGGGGGGGAAGSTAPDGGSASGGGSGAPALAAASSAGRRPYEGRCRLPAPKPLGRGFSIWSILKNMIGRDLTKITMPATINEPLSITQRMAEVLENRSLLEQAAVCPDPLDRLMLVSCWLVAGYNSQPLRDNKPFNPLLGETFEWQAPDGGARYICEQVSHHPPVSCFVAEGAGPQGYEFYGEVETKTKFWGKTIDCVLSGHMSLRLKAFGEEYRCNLGTLVINDIILGRFWIDLSCDMRIRNMRTGDAARVVIKPCRGYPYLKERGKCEGVVCDAAGREVWRINGSSMASLFASLTPEAAAARAAAAAPPATTTSASQHPPSAAPAAATHGSAAPAAAAASPLAASATDVGPDASTAAAATSAASPSTADLTNPSAPGSGSTYPASPPAAASPQPAPPSSSSPSAPPAAGPPSSSFPATTEPLLIWSKPPELPDPNEQYCMTRFALTLNDPADPVVPHLPATDARFRPDMRALELGEWNRATSEKLRLEEKQRTARRLRKEAGQEYEPRWFRQVLFGTKDMAQPASQPGAVWEYRGEYWRARERRQWGELPDIY
ncbi:hypothetical protein Agub_g15304 [Astrephomene gubernaculifera]|uniref:PH domain-containing protein n=1 Tax=Astrephomene gubernaculifera TaxID=47775 RepID=A0AAD3E3C8_9CHLO|nr:hypothetical protein Agub_g15304 [Astrephomene gubernaculifera]